MISSSKMEFLSVLLLVLPSLLNGDEHGGYDPTGGVSENKKLKLDDTYKAPSCSMETQEHDQIYWHYKGMLLNGHVFDEGNFKARLGHHDVITGVDKGMRGLCVGDKRRMTIHADWAYGEKGVPGTIPPKSTLIFDVELLTIDRPGVGKVTKDDILKREEEPEKPTTTTEENDGGVSKENKLKIEYIYEIDDNHCKLTTQEHNLLTWSYEALLTNGTEFDNGQYTHTLGSEEAIIGLNKGLQNMCVGDRRQLTIHSEWAYGPEGRPGVPANSSVVFKVELISIETPEGDKAHIDDVREFIHDEHIDEKHTPDDYFDAEDDNNDKDVPRNDGDNKKLKLVDTFKSDRTKCSLITKDDDKIHWNYKGLLLDGTVIDEGDFYATLGHGDVITGVDAGMRGMCVGDRRTMTMHSDWAYGDEGTGSIPPKATLIFEVELLQIDRPDGQSARHFPIDPNTGLVEGKMLDIEIQHEVDDCTIRSAKDDTIHWHYRGTLLDGTEFHTGDFTAKLGHGQVITGVDKGMRGMCVGDKRRIIMHSDWAYGDEGRPGSIPPKATLIFDVEMKKIEREPEKSEL